MDMQDFEMASNRTSTYDLVEDMYENMNAFDQKIKDHRQPNPNLYF